MNLAVVIAASEYAHIAKPLPPCGNDAEVVSKILEKSERFTEVFQSISEESYLLKVRLAEFVKKYHNTEISEIVFYFSGHGGFRDNDMYYLLNDFQRIKF